MSTVITLSNHKGGVGKTTSTINLGAGLHALGQRVLLVDLDPQANLSQSLGIIDHGRNIYGAMRGMHPLEPATVLDGFDAVPSTLDLSGAEMELSGEAGRDYILRELLEPLRGSYDFILIDSPPSLGLLTLNALVASDEILIPLQAQFLALQGLAKLLEVVDKVKKRLNKNLSIGGVFITQYDARKVLNREVAVAIAGTLGADLLDTKIRDNVALAEAPAQGVDIFRYSPKSNGAQDYMDLAREVMARG